MKLRISYHSSCWCCDPTSEMLFYLCYKFTECSGTDAELIWNDFALIRDASLLEFSVDLFECFKMRWCSLCYAARNSHLAVNLEETIWGLQSFSVSTSVRCFVQVYTLHHRLVFYFVFWTIVLSIEITTIGFTGLIFFYLIDSSLSIYGHFWSELST